MHPSVVPFIEPKMLWNNCPFSGPDDDTFQCVWVCMYAENSLTYREKGRNKLGPNIRQQLSQILPHLDSR